MNEPNNDPNTGTPPNEQPKLKPKRIRKPQAPRPKAKPKAAAPDCENCPFRKKALADAAKAGTPNPPPSGTCKTRIIDEIRKLEIPKRAKQALALLCMRAKKIGIHILMLLKRYRALGEAAVLGVIVAMALSLIPFVGNLLALIAIIMAAAGGMARQLKADLDSLFAEMPAYA